MRLYGRIWSLQVGSLLIEGAAPSEQAADIAQLQVEFKVRKSLRREPNEAEITIWNLNKRHRDQIASYGDDASVILRMGYEEIGLESIFQGDLRASPGVWDGPNVTTTLEGSDGGNSYRNTRVQRSFPRNTPVGTVLRAAVEALGVGLGNLPQVESSLALRSAGRVYPEGTVLSGPARNEVDRVVRSCGATWSIQNGVFQIRVTGPSTRTALEITPDSGLIGSPTVERDRNETVVHVEALFLPGCYPGRAVVLSSREVSGQYEIHRVEYVGSTRGTEWQVALELKEY